MYFKSCVCQYLFGILCSGDSHSFVCCVLQAGKPLDYMLKYLYFTCILKGGFTEKSDTASYWFFCQKMFLHLPAAVLAFILTHPVCCNSPSTRHNLMVTSSGWGVTAHGWGVTAHRIGTYSTPDGSN